MHWYKYNSVDLILTVIARLYILNSKQKYICMHEAIYADKLMVSVASYNHASLLIIIIMLTTMFIHSSLSTCVLMIVCRALTITCK